MAALFFDVDGTLIDSYHDRRRITPALMAQLARVQALGHRIFLSSGRSRVMMTSELLEPGFDGMVLINGGCVEMGGEFVYEERMGYELACATVDFLVRRGLEYHIVTADAVYTQRSFGKVRDFFDRTDHGDEIFVFDYDLDEVLQRAVKVESIVARPDRPELTAAAARVLGPAITCDSHGGKGTFELYPTAISKARGIEVVLDLLGLSPQDAYGFGDGTNDLEMIRCCGVGVAMGNAEDEVKAAADIVCPPVWDDGLAQVLAELF